MDEFLTYSEISQYLGQKSSNILNVYPKVIGFINRKDKQQYLSLVEVESVSICKSFKCTHTNSAFWVEGRMGLKVKSDSIQESHANVVIVCKALKTVLIFNPWKRMNIAPQRIGNISNPHLTRVLIKSLKLGAHYRYFYILGQQTNDKLCREHCKRFLEN